MALINFEKILREKESSFQKYYEWLPWIFKNVVISLRGYFLHKTRYLAPFYEELKILEKTENYSLEELKQFQLMRLKELVCYARRFSPFYNTFCKKKGITEKDINYLEDLQKFPIIERDFLRRNCQQFVSKEFNSKNLIKVYTSGTSGSPMLFFHTLEGMAKNWAHQVRTWQWGGINPNSWRITLFGRKIIPLTQQKPPFWVYNFPEKQIFMSSFHLSPKNLFYYQKFLKKQEGKWIEGFPTVLSVIADFILSQKEKIPMKSVFTTGEPLLDWDREKIERAFNCKVFDQYGQCEQVGWIAECEKGKKHLDMEYGILEVADLDGKPLPSGKEGYFIWTGFINKAMPLLRYKINDKGILFSGSEKCECGRNYPLVEATITRAGDYLVTPEGNKFSPRILNQYLKKSTSLREVQFYQSEIDLLKILIVKGKGNEEIKLKESEFLQKEIQKLLGPRIRVKKEFVNEIPREKGGKFKLIHSEVKDEK
jgi:phenylacetate-CoA ligase